MGQKPPGTMCRILNTAVPPNDPNTLNVGATASPGSVGMQASQYSSLTDDEDFKRLMVAMEEDAEEADYEWKSNLGNLVFSYLSTNVLAEYKADGSDFQKAWGNYNTQWNFLEAGCGDAKSFLASYDIFSLRIGVLQRANERIEALVAIDFARLLGPILAFSMRVKKFRLAKKFQLELKELMEDLEAAKSAVTRAEVKTALNLVVSGITTIVAPEATLVKVLISGGAIVTHIVIDRSLGEGSVTGTIVTVAGDSGDFIELSKHGKEAIEKLKGGSKTIGVAGALITAALDIKDVYEGKDRVEEVLRDLEEVKKGYEELMAGVLPMIPDFIALERLIQSIPALVNKALAAGDDAAENYEQMRRLIQTAILEDNY